jgi:hypothetical protein
LSVAPPVIATRLLCLCRRFATWAHSHGAPYDLTTTTNFCSLYAHARTHARAPAFLPFLKAIFIILFFGFDLFVLPAPRSYDTTLSSRLHLRNHRLVSTSAQRSETSRDWTRTGDWRNTRFKKNGQTVAFTAEDLSPISSARTKPANNSKPRSSNASSTVPRAENLHRASFTGR